MSESSTASAATSYDPNATDGSSFSEVPLSVRQAGEAADARIRELAAAARGEPVDSNNNQNPPANAQDGVTVSASPTTPAAPDGTAPPGQEASAVDSELQRRIDALEQEARTWRGRTESERQRHEKAEQELRRQIEELSAAKAATNLAAAMDVAEATAEEIETYGPELLDVCARYVMPRVRKMVDAAVETMRAELTNSIAPVQRQTEEITTTVKKTALERFFDSVTAAAPEWRQWDSNPEFFDWLAVVDPLHGCSRKESLDAAVQSRDAPRVAAFFNAFLDQRGGRTQVPVGGTAQAPAQAAPADDSVTLADLAAPGGARQADTPIPGDGAKRWTHAEVRKFYNDVGRQVYVGREAEQERIERDISRALQEGRVV